MKTRPTCWKTRSPTSNGVTTNSTFGLAPGQRRCSGLNARGLLEDNQLADVRQQIAAYNFIIFETQGADFGKHEFLALNRQFGLNDLDTNLGADEDKVTALHVVSESDRRAQYIPLYQSCDELAYRWILQSAWATH